MDQSDHTIKMTKNYFKKRMPTRCDVPFRTNIRIEDNYATASLSEANDINNLELQHGASL